MRTSKLKEGASYIYEKADGITYAREFGSEPSSRFVIGMDFETKAAINKIKDDKLWGEIRESAKTNSSLQTALNTAIIIHELSKKDGKE